MILLTGTAPHQAESEGIAATSEVMVKSPLDLKIDRIEVQQGVKPEFESDSGNPGAISGPIDSRFHRRQYSGIQQIFIHPRHHRAIDRAQSDRR
ncbi:MAG: hypothetical protein IPM55_21635 [Acidobacteria bacterium]|nr:hypothetical protein [Acidobacteriota bacterium]